MRLKTAILVLICTAVFFSSSCDVMQGMHGLNQDDTHKDVLTSLLTPEGAEIVTDIEDLLILDSTQPFADLIQFYKTILFELGAQETGINNKHEGIWIYSGLIEGVRPITVELRDGDNIIRIYIIY